MMVDRDPLPPGWEARWDLKQQAYFFIDHNTRQTSWIDPRMNPQRKEYNNRYHGTQQPGQVVPITDQPNAKLDASVNALVKAFPKASKEVVRAVLTSCQNNHTRSKQALVSMGFSEVPSVGDGGGAGQDQHLLSPNQQRHSPHQKRGASPEQQRHASLHRRSAASPEQQRHASLHRRNASPEQQRHASPHRRSASPEQQRHASLHRRSASPEQQRHASPQKRGAGQEQHHYASLQKRDTAQKQNLNFNQHRQASLKKQQDATSRKQHSHSSNYRPQDHHTNIQHSYSPNQRHEEAKYRHHQHRKQRDAPTTNHDKNSLSPTHQQQGSIVNREHSPNRQQRGFSPNRLQEAQSSNQQQGIIAHQSPQPSPSNQESRRATTDHLRLSRKGNQSKADTSNSSDLSLSPHHQRKPSSSQPTSVDGEGNPRKGDNSPAATPSSPRRQYNHTREPEISPEEKKNMKQRLLEQFPHMKADVVEMALYSNNFDETSTSSILKKLEGTYKEDQNISTRKGENSERAGVSRSYVTSPSPDVSGTSIVVENSDTSPAQESNDPRKKNSQGRKISMRTLLVTSQYGSPLSSWMSRLPGVGCCLRPYKSTTHSGHTTRPMTHTRNSLYLTEPLGPDPALPIGPDKSLLSKDFVQAVGPNLGYRQGPDPQNLGDRTIAVGPNPDLVRGPVSLQNADLGQGPVNMQNTQLVRGPVNQQNPGVVRGPINQQNLDMVRGPVNQQCARPLLVTSV